MRPDMKLYAIPLIVVVLAFTAAITRAQDTLPSWSDGPAKKAITAFIYSVTKKVLLIT